jgi:DNA-binding transcriptional LysR family regulator
MAQKSEGVIDQIDALFKPKKNPSSQRLEGLVKITMPNSLGQQYLLPALNDLLKDHSGMHFDLRFSNLIDNVVADQMDIGVRVGFFSNNRNVARRVNEMKFHIVGTPELVAKTGMPSNVDDLFKMPYTGLIDLNTGRMWPWSFANVSDGFSTPPAFVTDDPEAELAAVLAGIGYGQLGDFLCKKYIRDGKLIAVLPDQAPAPWGVYVYRPQRGPVAERVRVVFDYLVQVLSNVKL